MEQLELKERLLAAVEGILDRATTLNDPRIVDAARELGLELRSLSILRAERAFLAALKPLNAGLDAPIGTRTYRLAVGAAHEVLDRLDMAGEPPTVKRDAFIEKFRILTGEHKVRLEPGGIHPLEFLRRANHLSTDLLGRTVIDSAQLGYWSRHPDSGMRTRYPAGTVVAVNGHLPESIGRDRKDHIAAGVAHIPLPTIAVAHAAYAIATSRDLFNGIAVRAGDPRWHTLLLDGPSGLRSFLGLEATLTTPIGGAISLVSCRISQHIDPDPGEAEHEQVR